LSGKILYINKINKHVILDSHFGTEGVSHVARLA
jgi:hypothetical protein